MVLRLPPLIGPRPPDMPLMGRRPINCEPDLHSDEKARGDHKVVWALVAKCGTTRRFVKRAVERDFVLFPLNHRHHPRVGRSFLLQSLNVCKYLPASG